MNKKMILSLILVGGFALVGVFAQGTKDINQIDSPEIKNIAMNLQVTSSDNELVGASAVQASNEFTLEEMLNYALQDEQLALAEYVYIMEKFNVSMPFSNIARAEVTHARALLGLYGTYGYSVPEFNATDYVVVPDSLQEIFEVGIQAEIANIDMYNKFLSADIPSDVARVFVALRNASIHHLRAFQMQASRY